MNKCLLISAILFMACDSKPSASLPHDWENHAATKWANEMGEDMPHSSCRDFNDSYCTCAVMVKGQVHKIVCNYDSGNSSCELVLPSR